MKKKKLIYIIQLLVPKNSFCRCILSKTMELFYFLSSLFCRSIWTYQISINIKKSEHIKLKLKLTLRFAIIILFVSARLLKRSMAFQRKVTPLNNNKFSLCLFSEMDANNCYYICYLLSLPNGIYTIEYIYIGRIINVCVCVSVSFSTHTGLFKQWNGRRKVIHLYFTKCFFFFFSSSFLCFSIPLLFFSFYLFYFHSTYSLSLLYIQLSLTFLDLILLTRWLHFVGHFYYNLWLF